MPSDTTDTVNPVTPFPSVQQANLDLVMRAGTLIHTAFATSDEELLAHDFVFHFVNPQLAELDGELRRRRAGRRRDRRVADRRRAHQRSVGHPSDQDRAPESGHRLDIESSVLTADETRPHRCASLDEFRRDLYALGFIGAIGSGGKPRQCTCSPVKTHADVTTLKRRSRDRSPAKPRAERVTAARRATADGRRRAVTRRAPEWTGEGRRWSRVRPLVSRVNAGPSRARRGCRTPTAS